MGKYIIIGLFAFAIGCGDKTFHGTTAADSPENVPEDKEATQKSVVAKGSDVKAGQNDNGPADCKLAAAKTVFHPDVEQAIEIEMTVSGAITKAEFDSGPAKKGGETFTVTPTATKTYSGKVTGSGKSKTCELTIVVASLQIASSITITRFATDTLVGKLRFDYTVKNLDESERIVDSSWTTHTEDVAFDNAAVGANKTKQPGEDDLYQQTFSIIGYYKSTNKLTAYTQQIQQVRLKNDKNEAFSKNFGWTLFTFPQSLTGPFQLSDVPVQDRFSGTAGSPDAKPVGPIVKQ